MRQRETDSFTCIFVIENLSDFAKIFIKNTVCPCLLGLYSVFLDKGLSLREESYVSSIFVVSL